MTPPLSHKAIPIKGGGTRTSPYWQEHDKDLRHYALHGIARSEAAELLGISVSAVTARAQRIGLTWARAQPNSSPFWIQHDAELKRYAAEGLTTSQAAKRLGISKGAVVGRGFRIGVKWSRKPVAPRKREERVQQPRAWDFPPPGGCVFPVGHVNEPSFHFCGEGVRESGNPYCQHHHEETRIPASRTAAKAEEWDEERRIVAALRERQKWVVKREAA